MEILGQSTQIIAEILSNPLFWVLLVLAVILGGPIGMIPGVGGITLVAIALPFVTMNLDPVMGMLFIVGILALGNTLDAVPAVLLGYPTAATQVTFFEGHQLAQKGEGGRTLGAIYAVSAIGGIVAAFTLALLLPVVRPFVVRFSYPEITVMALFGITLVSILSRGAKLKGLVAALFGLLVAMIGVTPFSPITRFNFGEVYLMGGLPIIPVVMGLFALPEVVDLTMTRRPVAPQGSVAFREVMVGVREGMTKWGLAVRHGLIGVGLGIIPGVGSGVVDWMSYMFGMALERDAKVKAEFGKGSLNGVLYAESAQSAQNAGQGIPTLAFGIPGSVSWALVLTGLLSFGLAPGVGMLGVNLNVTMGIILAIGLGNLLVSILAVALSGPLLQLSRIPYPFIGGALLPLMFVAAYQSSHQFLDIIVMLLAGALGLAMKWWGWPRPPFILAFILGPIVEAHAWPAIQMGQGITIFFTRPFSLTMLILGAGFILLLLRSTAQTERSDSDNEGPIGETEVLGRSRNSQRARSGQFAVEVPLGVGRPRTLLGWLRRLHLDLRWRWEYLLWLVMLGWVAGVVLPETLGYRTPSVRFLPLWASVVFLALMATLIVATLFSPRKDRRIMDIGMRSGTGAQAFRLLIPMVGWIVGFTAAIGILGFQLAAVVFPVVFILANLSLRGRERLWVLVPALMLLILTYGIMENLMHVRWPDPVIRGWFFG